jgi:hypothetical protein
MPEYVSTPNQARNAWVSPYPFEPIPDGGRTISATTASSRVELSSGNQIVISNIGSETGYVRFGDSTVIATTDDYVIFPNTSVLLTVSMNRQTASGPQNGNYIPYTHCAGITASSTTSLKISTGWGL